MHVVQTGPWILPEAKPLERELQNFLDNGEPPVYLGFGSMPVADGTDRTLIDAVRAIGRRVILSQGWAELGLIDDEPGCIAIGEVDHNALFPRVAAVVHHGGAGTTTTAARAGVPQLALPMFGDQFYWGRRVSELGIGTSFPFSEISSDVIASSLLKILEPSIATRALSLAKVITPDGAAIAARQLVEEYGQS
jgi:vancomycin aglycone glucosyltransferase